MEEKAPTFLGSTVRYKGPRSRVSDGLKTLGGENSSCQNFLGSNTTTTHITDTRLEHFGITATMKRMDFGGFSMSLFLSLKTMTQGGN